jgi:hypothetical protein
MRRSQILASVLALVLLAGAVGMVEAAEKNEKAEAEARKAAEAWLALVDGGKYAESWDGAAAFFRRAITRDAWVGSLRSVRAPLGKLEQRKLQSAQYATGLPGAPAGQYVVLQFATRFANKPSAVETVTPMLDPDGKWRVSGYYIR